MNTTLRENIAAELAQLCKRVRFTPADGPAAYDGRLISLQLIPVPRQQEPDSIDLLAIIEPMGMPPGLSDDYVAGLRDGAEELCRDEDANLRAAGRSALAQLELPRIGPEELADHAIVLNGGGGRVLGQLTTDGRGRARYVGLPAVAEVTLRVCSPLSAAVFPGKMLGAVRLILDSGRKAACAARDAFVDDLRFLLRQPQYGGVADPAAPELIDLSRHLQHSSDQLAKGDVQRALDAIDLAKSLDPQACLSVTAELQDGAGRPCLEISADSIRRLVLVKYWPPPSRSGSVVAVLAPENSLGPALRMEMQPVEGEPYLLAEFENIPENNSFWQVGVEVAGPSIPTH